MTSPAVLLPLWVEQAEIAWRQVGPSEAERVLRDGLAKVAATAALNRSPIDRDPAALVAQRIEREDFDGAWDLLRSFELIECDSALRLDRLDAARERLDAAVLRCTHCRTAS